MFGMFTSDGKNSSDRPEDQDAAPPSAIIGLLATFGIGPEEQRKFAEVGKQIYQRFCGIESQVHQNALQLKRIEDKIDALAAAVAAIKSNPNPNGQPF
jgi:hypothetical protein